ncbi:unnamed protein product, partial [Polarella glacialis]
MAAMELPARQRRRSLLGLIVLTAGLIGPAKFLSGPCFSGLSPGLRSAGRIGARGRLEVRPVTAMSAAIAGQGQDPAEQSDFDKFFDRWNTRGGAVLVTVFALFVGLAMEKLLELFSGSAVQSGIWTSGIFFF